MEIAVISNPKLRRNQNGMQIVSGDKKAEKEEEAVVCERIERMLGRESRKDEKSLVTV